MSAPTLPTLQLYRSTSKDDGTSGVLMRGDATVCFMVELPWRNNKRGVSSIPAGRYKVDYMASSASGKYKDVYHVQSVPGRSGILIHKGNWAGDQSLGFKTDSDGCLLPCARHGLYQGQLMGVNSKTGLQQLHDAVGRTSFMLEVLDA